MDRYADIAISIAWPDQTARGDERWMSLLKRIGIVKNLNFRVGHAAIVLIERNTGQLRYFDFGRYITPRGRDGPVLRYRIPGSRSIRWPGSAGMANC